MHQHSDRHKLRSPSAKGWFKALPVEAGRQEAKPKPKAKNWKRDLVAEGIEPHPGPRAHRARLAALQCMTLNVNGVQNLWAVAPELQKLGVHVVCIQETNMNESQIGVLAQTLWKQGWVCHSVPAGPSRGVMTLVRKTLKSRVATVFNEKGGQFLAVQVGPTLVGNLYAAHHQDRNDTLSSVFEFLQSCEPNPWVVLGDFNDPPEESPLTLGLRACENQVCLPPPDSGGTRWEDTNRVIDYVVSNCLFTQEHLSLLPDRWSDHKAFQTSIVLPEGAVRAHASFEFVPANQYLPKHAANVATWTEQLHDAWKEQTEDWAHLCDSVQSKKRDLPADADVHQRRALADQVWIQLNQFLENFLQHQARIAHANKFPMKFHGKPHRQKGALPALRKMSQVVHQPYMPNAPGQLRLWTRLCGRLLEAERQVLHGQTDGPQVEQLWKHIRRCPVYTPGMTASQAETQVRNLMQRAQLDRLQEWRQKLQYDHNQVFRWVRRSHVTPTNNLFDDEFHDSDVASQDAPEALEKISQFWRRVWDRPTAESIPVRDYLNQFGGQQQAEEQWAPISAAALFQAAVLQKNRAGGPDGWAGGELAALPFAMWCDLTEIFQTWESIGCFPTVWNHITQVMIPKAGGLRADGATPISKLRPISLLSGWWRVYCRARLSGIQEQSWLERHLMGDQAGGRKNRSSQAAFVQLAECFATKKFIASLDYAKAFDHTSPDLACQTLQWLGCPSRLVEGILRLWGNQVRHISWNHSILSRPQHVGSSMPQGDSLSPRVLNLILAMPMKAVLRAEPDTQMVVFVDDRSWGSDTLRSLKSVLELWRRHSSWLGFKENINKSQFTHRDSSQRSRMEQDEDLKDHVTSNLWALGAAMGFGSILPKEEARVTKARNAASKIRVAPVSAGVRAFIASAAASAKATYGWLVRQPAAKDRKKLETQLRRVGFCHRMASPCLIRLVLGHTQDIEFQAGAEAVMAVWSLCKHKARVLRDWMVSAGPSGRIKAWLSTFGWVVAQPWEWTHPVFRFRLSLDPSSNFWCNERDHVAHFLREAWRHFWWAKYLVSGRREVNEFPGYPFRSEMVASARAQSKGASKHVVAVLTGAFVSPECRNRQGDGAEEKCPWCNVSMAHYDHVVWTCSSFPGIRPEKPSDPVVARLGWGNPAVLEHIASVRKHVLNVRYADEPVDGPDN